MLDAFHIWCAESAAATYFLTTDDKLIRVLTACRRPKTPVIPTTLMGLMRALMRRRPMWLWSLARSASVDSSRCRRKPQAKLVLDRYLARHDISTNSRKWDAKTPLIGSAQEDAAGVSPSRQWAVLKRFFRQASDWLRPVNAKLAVKLLRASPHFRRWERRIQPDRGPRSALLPFSLGAGQTATFTYGFPILAD